MMLTSYSCFDFIRADYFIKTHVYVKEKEIRPFDSFECTLQQRVRDHLHSLALRWLHNTLRMP